MGRVLQFSVLLAVLVTGTAVAQGGMYAGGGASLGYTTRACAAGECYGGIMFGVSANFGMRDLLMEDLGLRASAGIHFTGNATIFRVAVDAIYDIDVGDMSLAPYAGGGLRFGYANITQPLAA